MNIKGEEELRALLKAACKPVVASPEFKERLLKRVTQEVSHQAIQPLRLSERKPVVWVPINASEHTKELTSAELVATSRV
jgi:siroheme synthase (precorrin-2 oxidase/ferrochelatase)